MSREWTIARKGLVLVGVPLVFQAGFLALVSVVQWRSDFAMRWSMHSKEVLAHASELRSGILEIHADAIADALAAGGRPDLIGDAGRRALPGRAANLAAMVSDNPEQVRLARRVAAQADELTIRHDAIRRWEAQQGADRETIRGELEAGKRSLQRFLEAIDAFVMEETRLDAVRSASVESWRRWLSAALGLGAAVAIGVCIAAARLFARGIAARLALIADNAGRLARNEPLGPPLAGGDEIAQLDAVFRDMARSLARSSERLKASEERFRLIAESIQDVIWLRDGTTREVLYVSPAFQEIWRRSRDSVDRSAATLPFVRTAEKPREERTAEGRTIIRQELRIARPDGTHRWISHAVYPVPDESGAVRYAVEVSADITESKLASERLQSAADEIRDLYDNAPCGYHSLDRDGVFAAINATELKWLQLRREDVVGRMSFADILAPQCRSKFAENFDRFRVDGEIQGIEFDLVRRDGSTFPVSLHATSIRDEAGEFVASRSTLFDIADRRRADELSRRYQRDLEMQVAVRTEELSEANRILSQKNQEIETFVYSVSHDLRSPLVNLQGFSKELGYGLAELKATLKGDAVPERVRLQATALLEGEMARSLEFIRNGVMRLSGIIDALLRLSRVGRVEYEFRSVDVGAAVARIVAAMHRTLSERGVRVTVGNLPPAWGDPTAIEQVFANLIGNAANYLDSSREGRIDVAWIEPPEGILSPSVVYCVRDNGVGIAEPYQRKIFQAFQRIHPHLAAGEGIGLAIVRRIVERHGGTVWVESTPGEGSAFYVSLPQVPAQACASVRAESAVRGPSGEEAMR